MLRRVRRRLALIRELRRGIRLEHDARREWYRVAHIEYERRLEMVKIALNTALELEKHDAGATPLVAELVSHLVDVQALGDVYFTPEATEANR